MNNQSPAPQRTVWPHRLGWILLSALLIGWAFILGVLVGQGVLASPEQIAAVQKWLGLAPAGPAPKTGSASTPGAPPAELSFYKGVQKNQTPPSEPEQKKIKPASPPLKVVVPKGHYTVQVASFKDEPQAQALVKRLKTAGLPAYQVQAQVQGVGLRFRVRVGPFAELEEATGAAGRIRLKQKLAAYVTRQE